MSYGYPVVLRLAGKRCVVIGTGHEADQKAEGLREAGAEVVVAPTFAEVPRAAARTPDAVTAGGVEQALTGAKGVRDRHPGSLVKPTNSG